MYIKYKSLINDKISIINVNLSSCEKITTNGENLEFVTSESSKENSVKLKFSSSSDSDLALEKLFNQMYIKSPVGNLLDLTTLVITDIEEPQDEEIEVLE